VTGGPTASRATAALASAGGHRELDRIDKLVDAGQQRAADQEKRNGAGGDRLTQDGTPCLPHYFAPILWSGPRHSQ